MVETSALVAVILEEPGWRGLAEQIVGASAFTSCFNVFEAALEVVRERQLTPSASHEIVMEVAGRLGVDVRNYELTRFHTRSSRGRNMGLEDTG